MWILSFSISKFQLMHNIVCVLRGIFLAMKIKDD